MQIYGMDPDTNARQMGDIWATYRRSITNQMAAGKDDKNSKQREEEEENKTKNNNSSDHEADQIQERPSSRQPLKEQTQTERREGQAQQQQQ